MQTYLFGNGIFNKFWNIYAHLIHTSGTNTYYNKNKWVSDHSVEIMWIVFV